MWLVKMSHDTNAIMRTMGANCVKKLQVMPLK